MDVKDVDGLSTMKVGSVSRAAGTCVVISYRLIFLDNIYFLKFTLVLGFFLIQFIWLNLVER